MLFVDLLRLLPVSIKFITHESCEDEPQVGMYTKYPGNFNENFADSISAVDLSEYKQVIEEIVNSTAPAGDTFLVGWLVADTNDSSSATHEGTRMCCREL